MGDELNQGHNSVLDDSNLAIIMLTNFILKIYFLPAIYFFDFVSIVESVYPGCLTGADCFIL
jgi:hypothetical protein